MRRGIEQPALLALTLDLDQRVAQLPQQADTGRLVIDEGAAAPVGGNQPAQHDGAGEIATDAGLVQYRERRMVAADDELRGNCRLLGAGPHQAGIGAPSERQAERVEQDRFAGAGLAGQHAQARPEGERQPVDQNHIANRQADEHAEGLIAKPRNDIGRGPQRPARAGFVLREPRTAVLDCCSREPKPESPAAGTPHRRWRR